MEPALDLHTATVWKQYPPLDAMTGVSPVHLEWLLALIQIYVSERDAVMGRWHSVSRERNVQVERVGGRISGSLDFCSPVLVPDFVVC